MSNKIKKLICSLLATAMLVGSIGLTAMAEPDDATTADAAVTQADDTAADAADAAAPEEAEAPTETEAPAATEAPAEAPVVAAAPVSASGANYDNDNYYNRALALAQSLGIISGYEDGSVRPDTKVTRAQMASIVLRMLAINSNSKYQNVFTDVTDAHWAADQIQTAYEAGIVNGMGNGTFAPDAEVTYAQVIVMLVNACGYREDAEYYGGWQQGYIKAAGNTDLNLLQNAPGNADEATDRGIVIKMVYNALLGDYKEIRSYEGGQPQYSSERTLAEAKFDVVEGKGLLIGTSKTTIGNTDVQEGQVEIKPDKEESTEVYNTTLTGLEDLIGRKVTYYYKETASGSTELLAVTYDSSKSETYEINDLDTIDNVTYDGGVLSLKINKVSKEKKATADAKYIYNGKLVDSSEDIGALVEDMEKGSIQMVKSDRSLDDYDTVFINSYITMVITSANDSKIIGKIQSTKDGAQVGDTEALTITVDDKIDRTVTVTKAGSEIRARNLKKNDVATIKASLPIENPEVLDIVVSGESVTGSVSAMSKGMDDTIATINGDRYEVANVAAGDLKTGSQGTYYLDMFGRIGYIESSVSGRLEAGEQYGWILNAYKPDGASDRVVKIMTQNGVVEYPFASSVEYWAPSAKIGSGNDGVTKNKAFMEDEVQSLVDNGGFPAKWVGTRVASSYVFERANGTYYIAGSAETAGDRQLDRPYSYEKSNADIRLVKFKVNGSGKITKLYCTVFAGNIAAKQNYFADGTSGGKCITEPYLEASDIAALKASAKNPLIFDPSTKAGSVLVGGLLAGYSLTDDCIEFDVPNDPAKYSNEDSYVVKNVVSSAYNLRENGVSDEYYFADYDGTTPAVLVKFVADPDAAVDVKLGTADSISMMVVEKVNMAYNAAEDKSVYKVVGYMAGGETSFTTTPTSALYDDVKQADKEYDGTKVWDGNDGTSLANYLHEGDIIVQSGGRILKLADAQKIYANQGLSAGTLNFGSDTRVKYYYGPVTASDIGDVSWFQVNGQTIALDSNMAMDMIEIDLSASSASRGVKLSEDLADVGDLRVQGEDPETTDYAFVRIAPKGALGEVIIFRVTQ